MTGRSSAPPTIAQKDTNMTHPNALVEAWLTRSRNLGHSPQLNYNDWGGTYYTAACPDCKATMSLKIHASNGLAVSYSARGVAWRRECQERSAWLDPAVAAMTSEERVS